MDQLICPFLSHTHYWYEVVIALQHVENYKQYYETVVCVYCLLMIAAFSTSFVSHERQLERYINISVMIKSSPSSRHESQRSGLNNLGDTLHSDNVLASGI